jgi:hypothetical protein
MSYYTIVHLPGWGRDDHMADEIILRAARRLSLASTADVARAAGLISSSSCHARELRVPRAAGAKARVLRALRAAFGEIRSNDCRIAVACRRERRGWVEQYDQSSRRWERLHPAGRPRCARTLRPPGRLLWLSTLGCPAMPGERNSLMSITVTDLESALSAIESPHEDLLIAEGALDVLAVLVEHAPSTTAVELFAAIPYLATDGLVGGPLHRAYAMMARASGREGMPSTPAVHRAGRRGVLALHAAYRAAADADADEAVYAGDTWMSERVAEMERSLPTQRMTVRCRAREDAARALLAAIRPFGSLVDGDELVEQWLDAAGGPGGLDRLEATLVAAGGDDPSTLVVDCPRRVGAITPTSRARIMVSISDGHYVVEIDFGRPALNRPIEIRAADPSVAWVCDRADDVRAAVAAEDAEQAGYDAISMACWAASPAAAPQEQP